MCVCVCMFIYKGHSKISKPHPDFRRIHLSPLYEFHLHGN